ncbi:hypothetical protein D3C81_1499140 [compost metagenome]
MLVTEPVLVLFHIRRFLSHGVSLLVLLVLVPFFYVNAFAQRVPCQGGTFDPRRKFINTGKGLYIFTVSKIHCFPLHQGGEAVCQFKRTLYSLTFDRLRHHGSRRHAD